MSDAPDLPPESDPSLPLDFESSVTARTPAPGKVPSSALAKSRFTPADLSGEWALKGCDSLELRGAAQPVLGRYVLLSKIAEGGMGAVYYGTHLHLGTEVAIKILLPHLETQQSDVVDRFFREARLAAQIRSRHLVRVLDVAKDAVLGAHFLVMEYVQGESAGHWIERCVKETGGGLSERDALDTVIAGTRGLAAAHAEGVVHRDVKPANILVPADDDGTLHPREAKLSDLGLARPDAAGSGLTDGDLAMGTPGYMAPEQTRDATSVRQPADVFAMGATLYALLTGDTPFRGTTPFEMLKATVDEQHQPLSEARPDVSDGTCAVVEHCLRKAADERFADAGALLEALEAARAALRSPDAATALLPAPQAPRTTRESAVPAADAPPPRSVRGRSGGATWALVAVGVAATCAAAFLSLGRAPGDAGDGAPPAAPSGPATDGTPAPEGALARIVRADGVFLLNEEETRLQQGLPLPIEVGSDVSTRAGRVTLATARGDTVELLPQTGVRTSQRPDGRDGVVLKWGVLSAEFTDATQIELLRFGRVDTPRGVAAKVRIDMPRNDEGFGRRFQTLRGRMLLSGRAFTAAIPAGVTLTLFSEGADGRVRSRRRMRFKTEGHASGEVRVVYAQTGGAGLQVVIPAGSAGRLEPAAGGGLRVLNAPDSPQGTSIRVERIEQGRATVVERIAPGRTGDVKRRPRRKRTR